MIKEYIYKDRDNTISLVFKADGSVQDISGTTRMTLEIGGVTIDSAVVSNVFDWSTDGANGRLDLSNLGHQSALKPGEYTSTLTIYDASYPNGLIWDKLILEVA